MDRKDRKIQELQDKLNFVMFLAVLESILVIIYVLRTR